MAARMGVRAGYQVISVDRVPERLARVEAFGAQPLNLDDAESVGSVAEIVREVTDGRGADSVIDAVGMEAHGAPVAQAMQKFVGLLPDAVAEPMMKKAGVDRLAALYTAFEAVRRGGTVSISGVYGGQLDPLPMMQIFDKGLQLRMGQAHVRQWTDEILPLLEGDGDPLGVDDLTTHQWPLEKAAEAYSIFQKKEDGAIKVVLKP
jgi:threonine dehydrogenase-like Zn-dependent dehydrogenase